MSAKKLSSILALTLCLAAGAADKEGKYAPEFTLSSPAIKAAQNRVTGQTAVTPESRKALDALALDIHENCKPECTMIVDKKIVATPFPEGKRDVEFVTYRFEFADGFWFTINTDPAVIELQSAWLTPTEWDNSRAGDRIQQLFFDLGRKHGLRPTWKVGGGHVNGDIESMYGKDGLLFRNSFVDWMNHSDLFTEVLGDNRTGSRALRHFGWKAVEAFKASIADYDAGTRIPQTPYALIQEINQGIYELYGRNDVTPGQKRKWHAIGLPFPRQEWRGFRAQGSFEDFKRLIRLIEARRQFIARQTEPIPVVWPSRFSTVSSRIARFRKFVEEAATVDPRIQWKDYRSLVPLLYRVPLLGDICAYGFRLLSSID